MRPLKLATSIGLLFAIFNLSISGQSVHRTKTRLTSGSPCSMIVTLDGDVNVNCSKLTPAQRKLINGIPALLNKILVNRLDPADVTLKLDEIIAKQGQETEPLAQSKDQMWRQLTDAEKIQAESQLLPFAGQKISIEVGNLDGNRVALAKQLAEVVAKAKWDFHGISTPTILFYDRKLRRYREYPHGLVLRVGQITPASETLASILVGFFGRSNVGVWISAKPDNPSVDEEFTNDQVKSFPKDQIEIQIWLKAQE